MIRYSLRCDKDHAFESWFASSAAFDQLRASGLVACAICGGTSVEKELMAPAIGGAPVPPPGTAGPVGRPAALGARLAGRTGARRAPQTHRGHRRERRPQLRRTRRGASTRATRPRRTIIGEARPADARALIEDGIPVAPLPWGGRKAN